MAAAENEEVMKRLSSAAGCPLLRPYHSIQQQLRAGRKPVAKFSRVGDDLQIPLVLVVTKADITRQVGRRRDVAATLERLTCRCRPLFAQDDALDLGNAARLLDKCSQLIRIVERRSSRREA